MGPRRNWVEEHSFAEARDAVSPNVERMDDVLVGIIFALECRAELGSQTAQPGIRGIATRPWPGAPELVIYYRFDDHSVYGLDIRPA